MAQVVPYRIRPGDPPSGPKQPWLLVYLNDDPIIEWMMVDSGSTNSLVPLHVAQRIGLTMETQMRTGRGVSTFSYWRGTAAVRARTEFGEGFTLNDVVVARDLPFGLLGRSDFFEAFLVLFDQRKLQMEIDRQRAAIGFGRPN